jgi:hypothetical protein
MSWTGVREARGGVRAAATAEDVAHQLRALRIADQHDPRGVIMT